MVLELAVKGALDRLANAARQVDVGRIDNEPVGILLYADDPVERMLPLLGFLLVADEPDNLLFVLSGEGTLQG
jgi:hypothetical protein